ncbi:hypothetical protein V493_07927 [Pseudogymnoascus sp. VKM F-4281 (FW-2241)]|nr:hypothetical protein V493_07927 [Pseudogymnoascus sp. VKM F-4281 (FW-2241)]
MASVATMSPAKVYGSYSLGSRPPPSPYSQPQSAQPSPYSVSGLISPPISNAAESRRTSDDTPEYAPQQRQSLPSISEALLRAGTQGPSQPPSAASAPSQPFANPNPFTHPSPTPTSRSYSSEGPPFSTQPNHSQYSHRPSPPPLQPPSSFPGYNGHFSAPNPDAQRHQSLPSLRTALPSQTNPFPARQPEQGRYEQAPRPAERPESHLPRRQNDPYYGYPTDSTGYTPEYSARPRSLPYYNGQGPHREEPRGIKRELENGEPEPSMMFQKTLQNNLRNHDFEMALSELQQCGTEISKISEDILDTMRRSQRDPDAQGIPVMRFHDPMLGCQRKLEEAFHNVKHFMAQQQRLLDDHRQRNQNGSTGSSNGGNGGPEYGAEGEQWGADKEPGFSGPDPKKIRRGRAAPPGRCHSCNRAETPEWRRGPDGAHAGDGWDVAASEVAGWRVAVVMRRDS